MKRELEHNVTENTFQTPLHPVQLPPVFHALAMSIQEKKLQEGTLTSSTHWQDAYFCDCRNPQAQRAPFFSKCLVRDVAPQSNTPKSD